MTYISRNPIALPLNPNDPRWVKFQPVDWGFSNPGGSMVLTKGTAGAVDWLNTGAEDGLALIYQKKVLDLVVGDRDTQFLCQIRGQYGEATVDGFGVGLGFVNHPSTPTKYAMRLNLRTSAGNHQPGERSNITNSVTGGAPAQDPGIHVTIVHAEFTLLSNYALAGSTPVLTSQKNHGAAFQDYSSEAWYPAVFCTAGAGGGAVTFTKLYLHAIPVNWGD